MIFAASLHEPDRTVFFHFCRGEQNSPHLSGLPIAHACAPAPRRRPYATASAVAPSRGDFATRGVASPTRRQHDAIRVSQSSPRPHPYVQERIDWNEKRNADQRIAAGGMPHRDR